MNAKLGWILAICLALAVAPAMAQERAPQPGVEWSSLSEAQQKILAGQAEAWDKLPPGRQQAMARGSERWLSMTPDQQARAGERWKKWKKKWRTRYFTL